MTEPDRSPALLDVALQPSHQAQVGVGVDEDLDVHQVAQPLVGEDQDALDQDDGLRIDAAISQAGGCVS